MDQLWLAGVGGGAMMIDGVDGDDKTGKWSGDMVVMMME